MSSERPHTRNEGVSPISAEQLASEIRTRLSLHDDVWTEAFMLLTGQQRDRIESALQGAELGDDDPDAVDEDAEDEDYEEDESEHESDREFINDAEDSSGDPVDDDEEEEEGEKMAEN